MIVIRVILVAVCCVLWSSISAAQGACANWNTLEFFKTDATQDVVRCIAKVVDPTARDDAGRTPLHMAAGISDSPAVIAALLDAGADLEARDVNGMTPLHWAAGISDSPAVIAALLGAGADVQARDGNGMTPLHWVAAFNDSPAVIKALVDAGADLKARSPDGSTALHMAVRFILEASRSDGTECRLVFSLEDMILGWFSGLFGI